jgi:hypothetical protein
VGHIVNHASEIVREFCAPLAASCAIAEQLTEFSLGQLAQRSELTEPLARILICETVWGWSQKTAFSRQLSPPEINF